MKLNATIQNEHRKPKSLCSNKLILIDLSIGFEHYALMLKDNGNSYVLLGDWAGDNGIGEEVLWRIEKRTKEQCVQCRNVREGKPTNTGEFLCNVCRQEDKEETEEEGNMQKGNICGCIGCNNYCQYGTDYCGMHQLP